MIEIINSFESEERLKKIHQLPNNVRQMGEPSGIKRIFLEDYVYTYLYQYASSDKEKPQLAVLLGHYYLYNDEKVLLISAVVKGKNNLTQNSGISFSNETWAYIYENIEEYFSDYEIMGWMLSNPGYMTGVTEYIEKVHNTNFTGNDKVLYVIDPVEREDAFYIFEANRLRYQTGYYIYYERNEAMHKYMLDNKLVEEKIEPEAEPVIVNYRRCLTDKKDEVYQKKLVNMLYMVSGMLIIVVVIVGVAFLNNYDKMKNLEETLNHISSAFNQSGVIRSQEDEEQDSIIEIEKKNEIIDEEKMSEDQDEDNNNASSKVENNNVENKENTFNGDIFKTYKVKKGDTLVKICYKFYNGDYLLKEVQRINNIDDPNIIYTGQTILLPQP